MGNNRVTAMPAINAIPAVVAAPPGIVTYADLPPVVARSGSDSSGGFRCRPTGLT